MSKIRLNLAQSPPKTTVGMSGLSIISQPPTPCPPSNRYRTSRIITLTPHPSGVNPVNLASILHSEFCPLSHPEMFCKSLPRITVPSPSSLQIMFSSQIMALTFYNKYNGCYGTERPNIQFDLPNEEVVVDNSAYILELKGRLETIFLVSICLESDEVGVTRLSGLCLVDTVNGSVRTGDGNFDKEALNNLIRRISSIIYTNVKSVNKPDNGFHKAVIIVESWDAAKLFLDLLGMTVHGPELISQLYRIGVLPTEHTDTLINKIGFSPVVDMTNVHERTVLLSCLVDIWIRMSQDGLDKLISDYSVAVDTFGGNTDKDEKKKKNSVDMVRSCWTKDSDQDIPQSLKFLRWTKNKMTNIQSPKLYLTTLETTKMSETSWVSRLEIIDMESNSIVVSLAILPNELELETRQTRNCHHCISNTHIETVCPILEDCSGCSLSPSHKLSNCLTCWNCYSLEHTWQNCPQSLLTVNQRNMVRSGYRFEVSDEGQLVWWSSDNVRCVGEKEAVGMISPLLKGGINIFLGYNIYQVVMELLKMVTKTFSDNHFFISSIHGMVDIKWLYPSSKSLHDLIKIVDAVEVPDKPVELLQMFNKVVRKNDMFDQSNINTIVDSLAVVSTGYLVSSGYLKSDSNLCTNIEDFEVPPTDYNFEVPPPVFKASVKPTAFKTSLSGAVIQLTKAEGEKQEINILDKFSFIYVYLSWTKDRYETIVDIKVKVLSMKSEKYFTSRDVRTVLDQLVSFLSVSSPLFPNIVLVTVCQDARLILLKNLKSMYPTLPVLDKLSGCLDLWTVGRTDDELIIVDKGSKTRLGALYNHVAGGKISEFSSLVWTMQEIHNICYYRNNIDLPVVDIKDVTRHLELELKKRETVPSLMYNYSFLYIQYERADGEPLLLKVKCLSENREKYFSELMVTETVDKLTDYLAYSNSFPNLVAVVTDESDWKRFAGHVGDKLKDIVKGYVNLSEEVDRCDPRMKYENFARSLKFQIDKLYSCLFGKRSREYQSYIWTMQEIHEELFRSWSTDLEVRPLSKVKEKEIESDLKVSKANVKNNIKLENIDKDEALFKEKSSDIDEGREVTNLGEVDPYNLLDCKRIKKEPLNESDTVTLHEAPEEPDEYSELSKDSLGDDNKPIKKEKSIEEPVDSPEDEFVIECLRDVIIGPDQTKRVEGRILHSSSHLKGSRLLVSTHHTLTNTFTPVRQYVKCLAERHNTSLVIAYRIVLHLTNNSEDEIVLGKEMILGSAKPAERKSTG